MDREKVKNKLLELIEELTDLPAEEITGESGLIDDLELSSFEIMTMFADLEETFGIRISEQELRDFVTVDDVIDGIMAL